MVENKDFWKTTAELFSKLIEKPKMAEKLLVKPPPKYIYDIIINSMNATGFPKGLFTDEELNPKFFDESPQNKLEILQKAIDITKIVIGQNFEIKPKNILKGEEPAQTNYFLQMFHKAATSTDKDFQKYIKKYLDKRAQKDEDKKKKADSDAKPADKVPDKTADVPKTTDKVAPKDDKPVDKPQTKKQDEPQPKKQDEPKIDKQSSITNQTNPVVETTTKPARPASVLKRPAKLENTVKEVEVVNTNNQAKPIGIISDKGNKDDEEEGEKKKEKVLQQPKVSEEEVSAGGSKKITFGKLKPGNKDGKETPSVNITDIESIKNYVQEISRNANPIGKIIDFLPDDIESMNKELQSWIKEQKISKDKYDDEIKKSEETLQPLNNELLELEESIRDELVKINSIKYRIIRNEQIIHNLINNVISVKKE